MKKFLLSLSILLIWITNFSFGADSYTCSYKWILNEVASQWSSTTYNLTNCNDLGGYYDCSVFADISTTNGYCYQIWWFNLNNFADININIDFGWSYISFWNSYNNLDQLNGYTVCSPSRLMIQGRVNAFDPSSSFTVVSFSEVALTNYSYIYTCSSCDCPSCSQCESDLQGCQSDLATATWNLATCEWMYNRLETDYDLLSWNYNTCVSDLNSCMNNWWTSWSGDIQWSSLFINNNQLLWNKNIFINIPFEYEYSYTNEGEDFELDVVWLNQDEEYIEWVLSVQNYKPTSEDFTELISTLAPYSKILIFCVFLFIIWAWLKKPFKSKKL